MSEESIDEGGRGDFKDSKRPGSASSKLIVLAFAVLGVLLIAFAGMKLFGVFEPKQKVAVEDETKRPDSMPQFDVSLAEPPKKEPEYVECPGGLKLPAGLSCPTDVKPDPVVNEPQPQMRAEKQEPTEEELLQKRRFKSSVDVNSANGGAGAIPVGATADGSAIKPGASGLSGMSSSQTQMGSALVGTASIKTVASVNMKPSMTLAKGTLPDCTLVTAISTDQPGFLKCILSRPVYSMDGKVVLMEAGTTFEGEYGAGMGRGKKRMFAIWTRAITPNFVEVQLNSPTTDALGRSGMKGEIDNHYLERFGGAMLYSLFSDYTKYLMKQAELRSQERQAEITAGGTSSAQVTNINPGDVSSSKTTADRIVESMMKQGEEIQPTLYINQGEIIKIYVARDIDFSQVYQLAGNSKD